MSQPGVAERLDEWVDPVATRLADLRALTQGHILVLDANGRVIDYALGALPPEPIVHVVLSKDARGLLDVLTHRRLEGRSPHGAIVSGIVGDLRALQVPLMLGSTTGTCLTLSSATTTDIAWIVGHANELSALLTTRDSATEDVAAALLRGEQVTPQHWAGRPLHCALLRTSAAPAERRVAASRVSACSAHLSATVVPDGIALVLAASSDVLDAVLDDAVTQITRVVGSTLTGAVCGPVSDPSQVPSLLDEAREAAALARHGSVIRASAVATRLDVRRAVRAVCVSRWDGDLLQPLHDYDAARGADLARTLLGWLDGGGDTQVVAERLSVHANTLRYRLRRAAALLGADLNDVDTRLSVHLRLRGWAGEPPEAPANQPVDRLLPRASAT